SETGSSFHPIFFSQDRLLEELFCVCIQLLNKTWKEMRATQEDFDKWLLVQRPHRPGGEQVGLTQNYSSCRWNKEDKAALGQKNGNMQRGRRNLGISSNTINQEVTEPHLQNEMTGLTCSVDPVRLGPVRYSAPDQIRLGRSRLNGSAMRSCNILLVHWLSLEPVRSGSGLYFNWTAPERRVPLVSVQVMQVVKEQITRTLASKPTSLELFKNKVNALNYSEILKLRQTERLHQEETLAPPVLELKERLKPELLELIRQQRLNRLCQGTMFRKISSRRRQDKLWYCRLSPNHKMLHYGDVEEDAENPAIETLQDKIPVADIKGLLIGKDCPHMKENKGKQTKEVLDLAFSITYDVEECSLNFIAPSRTDFCLWTDGLSVLLGRDMSSESMRSELEILLSMEIKLRLLDLENVPIPDSAPAVPKPPSNYNFCYDFSQTEQ
ncbi:hypothetical protein CCH79_00020868, partial [Gambusia affinis]